MTNYQHLKGADRLREVFARIRNGDASAADLYTEDAVLLYGVSGRVEGREAIRAYYQSVISGYAPQPHPEAILEAPPRYAVVINVMTKDGPNRALDLFEIDDSGIRKLEIFHRG